VNKIRELIRKFIIAYWKLKKIPSKINKNHAFVNKMWTRWG